MRGNGEFFMKETVSVKNFGQMLVIICMLSGLFACVTSESDTQEMVVPVTSPVVDAVVTPAPVAPSSAAPAVVVLEEVLQLEVIAEPIDTESNIALDTTLAGMTAVTALCEKLGAKLGSVSTQDCLHQQLIHSSVSYTGNSLAYREFPALTDYAPLGRVLVIGGIHGDEFSSVSIVFKWMGALQEHHTGLFHWRFVPVANPDGLLQNVSQRQNSRGVDLNRNFPTANWGADAHRYWVERTGRNPRRDPGEKPGSELEIQWLLEQISSFRPDVIISMHAPYDLVDYDGPPSAPSNFGSLHLRRLGVFPGSLGNYAGLDMKIPVVTVELESAGIMPSPAEINNMWVDLVQWLKGQRG